MKKLKRNLPPRKINILVFSFVLVVIIVFSVTIVDAALNAELKISGNAALLPLEIGEMTGYGCLASNGCVSGATTVTVTPYNYGGVFDGNSIWLMPASANKVTRINPITGVTKGYGCYVSQGCEPGSQWPSGYGAAYMAFLGGVFDGEKVWMVPYNASVVISVDAATGDMTSYGCSSSQCQTAWPTGFSKSGSAFAGGVFDGQYIWLIPYMADRVIRIDKDTGEMAGYGCSVAQGCVAGSQWPVGFTRASYAFFYGLFDGQYIWMVPYSADRVMRIDKDTGEMVGYGCSVAQGCVAGSQWPTGFSKQMYAFAGGVDDGENIWLVPYDAVRGIKFNKETGVMSPYGCFVSQGCPEGSQWPAGFIRPGKSFVGGTFDGQYVYLIPYNADRVMKIDKDTSAISCLGHQNCEIQWPTGYTKGNSAFYNGAFDGENIWMFPYSADRVIKISP